MDEFRVLQDLLNRVYDGYAWHGPSIMEVLKDFPEQKIGAGLGKSANAIALLGHMIAWRTFVIKRLQGDEIFEITEQANFPVIQNPGLEDWKNLVAELKSTQLLLLELIGKLQPGKLQEQVAGRNYTFEVLLHGIIHHDVYHLGQLALIKKD